MGGYSFDTTKYKNKIISIGKRFGLNINLDNPTTIQDKLNWLNIYDPMLLKSKCADKVLLHEYSKETLGEDICVPIYGSWDKTKDIEWDKLPNKFALKCNHGSGMNIICKDKNKFNKIDAIKKLDRWLSIDYAFFHGGCESHYHDIKRKVFAEKYIGNENGKCPTDYKFWCFNGEPKFIHVVHDRFSSIMHFDFYDLDFNKIDLEQTNHPKSNIKLPTPKALDKMIEFSKKLSKPFKFVRCDFYEIDDEPILGEMTFVPDMGIFKYKDTNDNKRIGDMLKVKEGV